MYSTEKLKRNRRTKLRRWLFRKRVGLSVRWDILIGPLKRRLGWPVHISTMEELAGYSEVYENMPEHILCKYNLYKCKDCEELRTIEVEDSNDPENYYMGDGEQFATEGNEKVGLWCQYCEESFHEYGNTIIVVQGTERSKLTENSGIFWDWGAFGGDDVELDGHMQEIVKQLNPHYHRVDGWRGYDVFDTPSGYVNVRTGWVGWGSQSDFHDILESIMKGEHNLAYPVIVVIAKTSNIFSVNIDVYVPEEHEKDFERLFTGEEHVDFDSSDEMVVDEVTAMAAAMTLPMGGKKVEHVEDLEEGQVKIRVKQKSMDVWKPEKTEKED